MIGPMPPRRSSSHRDALRALIESAGILDGTQTFIRGKSGRPLSWLLYTPEFSLTAAGNRLAAQCLLQELEPFGSVQLATYGLSGMPLLIGTLLLGNGKYDGLMIRERAKEYGSMRRVDGPIHPELPVVVVDDSLVSGTAFYKAAAALEQAELHVLGLVCLVEFSDRGGRDWAESLGYRVASVFDIRDLSFTRPAPAAPSFARPPVDWPEEDRTAACDTLPELARLLAVRLLDGGPVGPVPRVEGCPDSSGGAFVSFRDVATDTRLVRDGFFWIDRVGPPAPIAVALATAKCVRQAARRLRAAGLENLKIGVSCMSRPQRIELGELDADRHGLLVRSSVFPWKMGAALPHTPDRESDVQQYHECLRKAGLSPESPQEIYGYATIKLVERGHSWQPYGATATEAAVDPDLPDYLRRYIAEAIGQSVQLSSGEGGTPSLPWPLQGVAVSIYRRGREAGTQVGLGAVLRDCVHRSVVGAWNAACLAAGESLSLSDCDIVLSLLHDRHALGEMSADEASRWFRPSEHTLVASTTAGSATAFPHLACHYAWDARNTAGLTLRKASTEDTPHTARWETYQTASWLLRPDAAYPMRGGFPARQHTVPLDCAKAATAIADYILAQSSENDGVPAYICRPVADTQDTSGKAGRVLLALTGLAEAGQILGRPDYGRAAAAAARRVAHSLAPDANGNIRLALPGLSCGITSEGQALLLFATTRLPGLEDHPLHDLAGKIRTLFREDGMISALPPNRRLASDHNVLPGLALTAMVRYAEATSLLELPRNLERHLAWYQRRFRHAPHWLAAGWLMQGWSALWRITHDPLAAQFVSEVAEWTMRRQFQKSGAFAANLRSRTGCINTAYLAEGLTDAWALSQAMRDDDQSSKLRQSVEAALRFVETLIVWPEDLYCIPGGRRYLGGVRHSTPDATMRIDNAAHALRALLGAIRNGATVIEPHIREAR
jgi:orotate phosphoribosyltransferase